MRASRLAVAVLVLVATVTATAGVAMADTGSQPASSEGRGCDALRAADERVGAPAGDDGLDRAKSINRCDRIEPA